MSDYIDQEHKIITKNRHLSRKWDEYYEKKTMIEIELATQKDLEPSELIWEKPLKVVRGQVLSSEEKPRSEYIVFLGKELEKVSHILKTIESLFEEEPENTNAIKD